MYSVVGNKTNIEDLCKLLQDEYKDFEFVCGQIISKDGDQIKYVITTVSVSMSIADPMLDTSGKGVRPL